MSTPRHFLAENGKQPTRPDQAYPLAHVIDTVIIGGAHRLSREWIVGLDAVGQLAMRAADDSQALMDAARAEYAYHDVARGAPPRVIDADTLFLMSVQLLEQPGDTPGVDNPVYLYGALHGPFPQHAGGQAPRVNGQLTASRASVLQAFVWGQDHVFSYENDPDSQESSNFFHLMLPADRSDAIAAGTGIVLAYPMVPPSVAMDGVGNDLVADRMLHDLLNALQQDLAREGHQTAFTRATIPVTNRNQVIDRLRAKGYRIDGNEAIQKTPDKGGFKGMLSAAFGAWTAEKLQIPPEGDTDGFFELARQALSDQPDWPPPRMTAVRQRVSIASAAAGRPSPARPPTASDAASEPISIPSRPGRSAPPDTPPSHPPSQPVPPPAPPGPPQWMRDFVSSHRHPSSAGPQLTYTDEVVSDAPDWHDDFDRADASSACSGQPADPDDPAGRDWMSDFDSPAGAPADDAPDGGDGSADHGSGPDWMGDFE